MSTPFGRMTIRRHIESAVFTCLERARTPRGLLSADPKLTRQFDDVAAIVAEARAVRIWGGIHFRSALDASDVMGRQVAGYLVVNPIRRVR